jgi:outer membrane lipoprotein-sorting protein
MNYSIKLFPAALFALGTLLAQGPPPAGGPGGPGFGGPGFGGPPVTGAPFSATKTDTRQQTLADGNQIQDTRTEKIYRDTDGRMRTESTMTTPFGTTKTMITIFDPVAGFVAHLNPADSTAIKQTLPPMPTGAPKEHKAPPADANAPQVVKTDLGASTVAGLAVTGTKTTRTIPAGAIGNTNPLVETREVWISTALKIPVQMTATDPEHGTSTMLFSNVSTAAPDPTLFQIPSTYTVKAAPAGGPHGHGGPGGPGGGPDGPPPPDGL